MNTSNNSPLPHSVEAEKAMLGALILKPDVIYSVAPILDPKDFYSEKNRQVYEAVFALRNEGQSCDPVTLGNRLERFSANGTAWVDYLGQLIEFTPDEEAAVDYAHIIAEKATRRRLISAASRVDKLARSEDGDIDRQLGEAETVLFSARGNRADGTNVKPEEYIRAYLDTFEELQAKDRDYVGLETGFIDLDRLLNGLQSPHHYVIAARPGMGKSSLVLKIAENVVANGYTVGFFSLEMSSKQIMDRRLAAFTKIDSRRLQRPWTLGKLDKEKVYEATGKLSERKLLVETKGGLSLSQLRARAMRLHAEHGLDLVIVDHLHLMRSETQRNRKDLEIDDNVRGLTALYKTLGIPGITVSQLNRGVESRKDKRPLLSDLRESGAIEEEAFVAMLLYRDEYYDDMTDRPSIAEVNIAKNREGPTGQVDLYWHGKLAEFRNLARQEIRL